MSFRWKGGAAENNVHICVIAPRSLRGSTSIVYINLVSRVIPFVFQPWCLPEESDVDTVDLVDGDSNKLYPDHYRSDDGPCHQEYTPDPGHAHSETASLFPPPQNDLKTLLP